MGSSVIDIWSFRLFGICFRGDDLRSPSRLNRIYLRFQQDRLYNIMVFGFGTSYSPSSSCSRSSSSSSTSTIASSPSDPANTKPAPNREQRAQCWTTRDAYFSCLDKNRFIQAGDERKGQKPGLEHGEGQGLCAVERGEYEVNCGKSWVREDRP